MHLLNATTTTNGNYNNDGDKPATINTTPTVGFWIYCAAAHK